MHAIRNYILFWLVLMVLAIGNGALREAALSPHMGELQAHQLSTVLAVIIFTVAVWLFSSYSCPESLRDALVIGFAWLGMTLCFEFLFGHYVAGHSWSRLLRDYDVLAGRIWPVLLVWITILPALAYRYRAS